MHIENHIVISYPTADYRLLDNLPRNRLAARRDYILLSSLPPCYIPLQVVPFPSSQSVHALSQQRSRGVQYREGEAKRSTADGRGCRRY